MYDLQKENVRTATRGLKQTPGLGIEEAFELAHFVWNGRLLVMLEATCRPHFHLPALWSRQPPS